MNYFLRLSHLFCDVFRERLGVPSAASGPAITTRCDFVPLVLSRPCENRYTTHLIQTTCLAPIVYKHINTRSSNQPSIISSAPQDIEAGCSNRERHCAIPPFQKRQRVTLLTQNVRIDETSIPQKPTDAVISAPICFRLMWNGAHYRKTRKNP